MSTEIYYFSGTGNSLYVARELQKRIPDSTLIPIVSLLQKDVIQTNGKSVGIVFPVHALTIPIAVKKFLKKTDMRSAEYIFAIATREGTFFRGFEKMEIILKKKNKRLDSHFILNMCMNDPRGKQYKSSTEADISKLEAVVQKRLDSIQRVIVNKEISKEEDSDYFIDFPYNRLFNYLLEKLVLLGMTVSEYIGGVNYFCSDSKCTGCGVCEKVCLSQKIKMIDKKPVWQKKVLCYMCYACVNYCPAQSVQINSIPFVKSYTRQNGRYSHPYATVKDIAGQKWI
ncbi:MAG: EFR1 family ferrodoxin [candidate division WOR-3 bacterium]|nr:EFR1 family ferrodoxin [candidate division WOR-3 bacterium]